MTKPGDVLRYRPARDHCREGIAFVRENGVIVDTFWHTFANGGDDIYRLRDAELVGATVLFNVNEYDALDRYASSSRERWLTFHPDDRGRITSQHGLQEALFTRKHAKPHLGTQIENARAALERAEFDLTQQQARVERLRIELASVESQAAEVGVS